MSVNPCNSTTLWNIDYISVSLLTSPGFDKIIRFVSETIPAEWQSHFFIADWGTNKNSQECDTSECICKHVEKHTPLVQLLTWID